MSFACIFYLAFQIMGNSFTQAAASQSLDTDTLVLAVSVRIKLCIGFCSEFYPYSAKLIRFCLYSSV